MQPIRVGDLTVHPIYDGTAVLDKNLWTGSDWTAHQHLLRDDGTMLVPVGGFLVRIGERLVLLDAGVGDVRNEMFDGGQLLQSLAALGVQLAHVDGGVPNIRIEIPAIDAHAIGSLLYFFEKACGISGYILGVNPFDQPGVEAYKKNMFSLLGKPEAN